MNFDIMHQSTHVQTQIHNLVCSCTIPSGLYTERKSVAFSLSGSFLPACLLSEHMRIFEYCFPGVPFIKYLSTFNDSTNWICIAARPYDYYRNVYVPHQTLWTRTASWRKWQKKAIRHFGFSEAKTMRNYACMRQVTQLKFKATNKPGLLWMLVLWLI